MSGKISGSVFSSGAKKPTLEKLSVEETEDTKIQKIFRALLEKITVRVPEILIRQEVNHSLSRMVQQLDRLKISLDDYLKSVKKTAEELHQEFAVQALTSLQVEFILNEIAKTEKFEVSEKEIDDIIASIPDENVRKASELPGQRSMVASTLLRRRTVEHLLGL
jgi:trigger factor